MQHASSPLPPRPAPRYSLTPSQEGVFVPNANMEKMMKDLCWQLSLDYESTTAPLQTYEAYSAKLTELKELRDTRRASGDEQVRQAAHPHTRSPRLHEAGGTPTRTHALSAFSRAAARTGDAAPEVLPQHPGRQQA